MEVMFNQHRRALGMDGTEAWVIPDGNARAPVIIAGWQAEPNEVIPFDERAGKAVRDVLGRMGVPLLFVRLSYVAKFWHPRARYPDPIARRAGDLFFDEVNAGGHQAVILLGAEAAQAVLRVPDHQVAGLRCTQFRWPGRSDATFFVTHPPEALVPADPSHQITTEFCQDLRAVFDVSRSHFNKTQILKGEKAPH